MADPRTHPRAAAALLVALALLLVGALGPAAARADTTIVVDTVADPGPGTCESGGSCSLREALERVEKGEPSGVSGDATIQIEVEGTVHVGATGELFVYAGEGVGAIAVEGPGSEKLTVSGDNESRVFFVGEAEATIAGMTIAEGAATGFAIDGDGGAGVFTEEGAVVLDGVRLTGNTILSHRDGGAVGVEEKGSVQIVDSRIDHNFSEESGGGAYAETEGGLAIEGTEIDHNTAEEGFGGGVAVVEGDLTVRESSIHFNAGGGPGGGIFNGDAATVERSQIFENTTEHGGGGVATYGPGGMTVKTSTVSFNKAAEFGGGIYTRGPATVEASTVNGNVAPEESEAEGPAEKGGGGIATEAALTLLDSTVAANSGGGLLNLSTGVFTVHGATIAVNTTELLPGAGIEGEGFTFVSSILAGNLRGAEPADCSATVSSEGGNLVGFAFGAPGCDWTFAAGDQFGADPKLGPLGNNGGPTYTMAPTSRESAAINNGGAPQLLDQRETTRPVPAGAAFTDVGAVEVQAPVNLLAPEVEPTLDLEVGETLACSRGEWGTDTVTDPTTAYTWVSGEEVLGSGNEYTLANGDAGKPVQCRVTVDNGAAATPALSNTVELAPAEARLEPASVEFGERRVGAGPGLPQTLTLTNDGSADLEVSAIWSNDPDQFPIGVAACTAEPLAPHQSCQIEASFSAQAAGVQTTTIVVDSNVADATAELKGFGTAPVFSAAPASFDFGSQRVGGGAGVAHEFVVTNEGDASMTIGQVALGGVDAADFQLGPEDTCSGATLAPGEECAVEAAFAPGEAGPLAATIEFPGDALGQVALSGSGAQPVFSAFPSPADFGGVKVGTSAQLTVAVTNQGDWSMDIGTVALSGAEAGSFGLASDGCSGQTLAAGSKCEVTVSFAPAATGAHEASLSFPGDAPGSVTLKGTGTAPASSVAPASFDFGAQLAGAGRGASEEFVVTNEGDAPMTVAQLSLGGVDAAQFDLGPADTCSGATVPAGGTCAFEVAFAPTGTGTMEATVEVPGDAPATVTLEGTGKAPKFSAAPDPLDFGSVLLGETGAAQTVTVTNAGDWSMSVGTVALGGAGAGDFAIEADHCSGEELAPGGECSVELTFTPSSPASVEATLSFPGDAAGSVVVKGRGVQPGFSVEPSSFDFGSQPVGGGPGTPKDFVVTNVGSAPMTIGDVALGGTDAADFQLGPGDTCSGATLAPAETCTVEASFAPVERWGLQATLEFPGDAPGSATLTGFGAEAEISAVPDWLDYGPVRVGSAGGPQQLTISNQGSGPMQIAAVGVEGPDAASFRIDSDNCAGETLLPAEECHVTVGFLPAAPGALKAALHFAGSDPASVELKGYGTAPAFSVSPGSFDFGARPVASGSGAPQPFVVTNAGDAPMTVGPVALSGTDSGDFRITGDGCSSRTLLPGAQCTVSVALAPTEPWNLEASLVFPGEAPGFAHLQGEGRPLPDPRAKPKPPKGALRVAGGKANLKLGCLSPSGTACSVKLTLQRVGGPGAAGKPPIPKRLGRWHGKVAAGRTKAVPVKLTAAARRALAAHRKLKVLAIAVTGGEEESRARLTLAR